MTDHAVVIAGGGPTGLVLGAELTLAGVDCVVVERRPDQELAGSRAGGLHARTLEVFDQRGIAERFLSEGQVGQVAGYALIPLDLSDFPSRHNYVLGLWQNHIERILAGWVRELRVPVWYGTELTGFTQDDSGVHVTLSDGRTLRAQYLVGCDGGRSLVRKTTGIEFPGSDPTMSALIAEVEIGEEPEWGVRRDAVGIHGISRKDYEIRDGKIVYKDSGPVRVMVTERQVATGGEPTLADVKAGLTSIYGRDFGIHSPTWISRFTDTTRQAAQYRKGRVLLAGDAAHVHAPTGGQGLNVGVQDAVNLGWKLAQVVRGMSPVSFLDTYHTERHPVAARVLRNTMAQIALMRADDRTAALREAMTAILGMTEPRRRIAGEISGLDIRYEMPGVSKDSEGTEHHPLVGRRMPDLDLQTAEGTRRVFTLLHHARPVLLNLDTPGTADLARWAERVQVIDARYGGAWDLPVVGEVSAPGAVLIRPDGYVAWVGDSARRGLAEAVDNWFGPGTAATGELPG